MMKRKTVLLFSLPCCHTCLQFTYFDSKLITLKQSHLEVPEHSGGGSRYDVRLSLPPLPHKILLDFWKPPPPTVHGPLSETATKYDYDMMKAGCCDFSNTYVLGIKLSWFFFLKFLYQMSQLSPTKLKT